MLNVRCKMEKRKISQEAEEKNNNEVKHWITLMRSIRQDGSISAKQKTIFPANQSSSLWIQLPEHFGFMAYNIYSS